MSAFSLVQGRIVGDIQTRPTKTGGKITFFKMQVMNGTSKEFWSISTFSDTVREELLGMGDGDVVSVVGAFHAELFEWKGAPRIALRLTADRVLALKPKPKATREKQQTRDKPSERGGRQTAERSWAAPASGAPEVAPGAASGAAVPFNDEIPFAPEWR
jgi:hypothetical protein